MSETVDRLVGGEPRRSGDDQQDGDAGEVFGAAEAVGVRPKP